MILALNAGSSSLKYKLFNRDLVEIKAGSFVNLISIGGIGHAKATKKIIRELGEEIQNIDFTVNRVVLAGDEIKNGQMVTTEILKLIKKYEPLAPLHNPPAIATIKAIKTALPDSKHTAVYDNAYYLNMLPSQKYYALNRNISQKYNIKRYGFHGISHQYAYENSNARNYEKVISIHLGAGCSVTAIKNGCALANSMGMTPLAGLIMQTRCGDIDPGVVLHLVSSLGIGKTKYILEHRSGLAGLTGNTGEMLKILKEIESKQNEKIYQLNISALEQYTDKIKEYIGSYAALMTGVDAMVFTGKIGAGSALIRDKILSGLDFLQVKEVNTIEPNEELAMAQIIHKLYYLK